MSNIKHFILKTFASSIVCFMVGTQNYASCMEQSFYENLKSKANGDETMYHYLFGRFIPKDRLDFMVDKGYKIETVIGAGHSGITFLAISPNGDKCVLKYVHSDVTQNFSPFYTVGARNRHLKINEQKNSTSLIYNKEVIATIPRIIWNDASDSVKYPQEYLVYDELSENGDPLDFGPYACKILGKVEIPTEKKDYDVCMILEFIDGDTAYDFIRKNKFTTTDVAKWLKNICTSLKLMYNRNFLHRSIGISNVMIRNNDKTAVLIDYERAIYKDLFEFLMKFAKESEQNMNGQYYDKNCILTFINDLTGFNNYNVDNQKLHNDILSLESAENLEELLKKNDELKIN